MTHRRQFVIGGLAASLGLPSVQAQQRRSLTDPLRVGADHALIESGLASALQKAFGRDTGIAVLPVPGPAVPTLDALERGELDAALTNAPEPEERLDRQGLVHDRQAVAQGSFVIVGPAATKKVPDPAGIAKMTDATQALLQLRDAAAANGEVLHFLSAGDGSGTHVAEQALWRAAKAAPAAPWYVTAAGGAGFVRAVRERGAYALVERGAWLAAGGAPLAMLVEDPHLVAPVHVMRSFRVNHPAAKIFVAWITGPKGRRTVAAARGYHAPT